MSSYLLLIFAAMPDSGVVDRRCDVIERNVVGEDRSFRQWVFWDFVPAGSEEWDAENPDQCARAWVAIQNGERVVKVHGYYTLLVYRFGRFLRVTAPAYKETWTGFDAEVLNRRQMDCERWSLRR